MARTGAQKRVLPKGERIAIVSGLRCARASRDGANVTHPQGLVHFPIPGREATSPSHWLAGMQYPNMSAFAWADGSTT